MSSSKSSSSSAGSTSAGSEMPESVLQALAQAKLHIDAALAHAGTASGGSSALSHAMRAMDPTNSGCSNCSCGGGGMERDQLSERT